MSREEFIENIAKYVKKYAPSYNIKVYSPIIAQAILESGYGESLLSSRYNNHFGLKCGGSWNKKSVIMSTWEEFNAGEKTPTVDSFRVYDSFEEGVLGYFDFINWSNYFNLKGITDARTYCEVIKRDGYATANNYVDVLMDIINDLDLRKYDEDNEEEKEKTYNDKEVIDLIKVAKNVILGLYGNGEDRKNNLNEAGYDFSLIQDIVDLII